MDLLFAVFKLSIHTDYHRLLLRNIVLKLFDLAFNFEYLYSLSLDLAHAAMVLSTLFF